MTYSVRPKLAPLLALCGLESRELQDVKQLKFQLDEYPDYDTAHIKLASEISSSRDWFREALFER
jgi:hypothetical protein